MGLGSIGQLAMLGYSLFGGGGSGTKVQQYPTLSLEQGKFLRDLSQEASRSLGEQYRGPGPLTASAINQPQQAGANMLNNMPALLNPAYGVAGQGQETLMRMLNPNQNMDYAMKMFQPIQENIANRFASIGDTSNARGSGFGQALGRGFAEGVLPQVYNQQAQALGQVPQMASLPMSLLGQAAGGQIAGGTLQRDIGNEYQQALRQQWLEADPFGQYNNLLNRGLQAAGMGGSENIVSQSMTPQAMMANLAGNQGVWDFIGGFQWPSFGNSNPYPNEVNRSYAGT